MLDYILALAVTTSHYTIRKEPNTPIIVVGKELSSKTEQHTTSFSLEDLKINSVATYWSESPESEININIPFISPIKHSVEVKASFIVGGKIDQLPLDDERVYFDE